MFRKNLVQIRKDKKITQSRLASLLGISQSHVCNYETGERSPGLKKLLLLCKVLEVSPNELIGWNDDKR